MPKKFEPPHELPARLLSDAEMIEACRERDFSRIFTLVRAKAGIFPSLIARRCDLTPSRVSEVLKGDREIKEIVVIERVADGLHIPGHMVGLAPRHWETGQKTSRAMGSVSPASTVADLWLPSSGDDQTDPEFVVSLVRNQLPHLYESANFFGGRQAIPSVLAQAHGVTRTLETGAGSTQQAALQVGSRIGEFLGWLYQDVGDFRAAAYWSDRAMEWAQQAADDRMQSYVLFRKANQAAARSSGHNTVGLARAAQRIPGTTPEIAALAAQQEAQGYALMGNLKAALAKFDEAHSLASQPSGTTSDATLDTAYCTPTYIEVQRAQCWIEHGEPLRAVQRLEEEIATLPQVYRNDRGVFLARLAHAYAKADEPQRGADAAEQALRIANQTGSARTIRELGAVVRAVESHRSMPEVAGFTERFRTARGRSAGGQAGNHERC